MKIRFFAILGFCLLATIFVGFLPAKVHTSYNNNPNQNEIVIIKGVLDALQQLHYQPIELDDDLSGKAFKSYMERLDGGKRFFTKEEYEELAKYEFRIDDEFKNQQLSFFDLSLELIEKAVERSKSYIPGILENAFDFTISENIEFDPEKLNWAENEVELKEQWRKILKYETLTKLYNKMDNNEVSDSEAEIKSFEELEQEAREEVKKNFENWFDRMQKLRRSDRFGDYVNSVTEVFDPHTNYYSPKDKEDFDINMSGRLEGIGARLQTDDEYTKVESIVPGGPAWKQKELDVNDQIMKVTQDAGEPLDIRGMRIDDVVKHIRGKKGTKVTLTVRKQDGSSKDITIVRDEVILDEGFAKSAIIEHSEIIDNIGYIRLPRFYADFEKQNGSSCSKDVAAEIEKLKKSNVKGIILDLRNNGGGSLRDVVDMSGLFIESGPIVQVKSRNQKAQVLNDQDTGVQYDGPLVVMVNTFSASASEILAAALQDYNRALIVGSPSTFGKGTVQRFYDLDRLIRGNSENKPFGEVKLTMQKFYRIDGGSTQLKGVIPDVVLPDSYMFFGLGEKEYEHPMEWSEIEALAYGQNVYQITDKQSIVEASKLRVQQDSVFSMIEDNAYRIKAQRDERTYPISLEGYKEYVNQREAYSKRYESLQDRLIPGMNSYNLDDDLEYIKMDDSRIARNDTWMESIRKDIYLKETLHLMRDMISGSTTTNVEIKKQ